MDTPVELVIGGRVLALVQGDITRFPADAIGNAANESLGGGGGVDGAIHRAGGPAIMAELEARYGRSRRCPTGSAVVTGAGRLPARWVIHAVGPVWRGGRSGEPELLASAYRVSLEIAERLGARSVAFPAISCGVYGYPAAEAARVAVGTVARYLAEWDPGAVEGRPEPDMGHAAGAERAPEPDMGHAAGAGDGPERAQAPETSHAADPVWRRVERVTFVVFSRDTLAAFVRALAGLREPD